nr:hypothetical protein [candidate division Zixibacteria bacterium]
MRTSLKLTGLLIALLSLVISAAAQETPPKFQQPILISSAGQSADMKLIEKLAGKEKLETKAVNMAQPSDLDGIKTLILVPGFSSKGLGAAGVSQNDEMARVEVLIKAAQEKKIDIVMVHIGGTARRKGQSDAFNKISAEASKQMIVVSQGDEDKFFTNIAKEKNIPIEIVEKIIDTAEPLGKLFK